VLLPPAASLLVSCTHRSRSAKSSPVIWIPSGKSWLNNSATDVSPNCWAGGLGGSAGMSWDESVLEERSVGAAGSGDFPHSGTLTR
jgi:hypothetical protein